MTDNRLHTEILIVPRIPMEFQECFLTAGEVTHVDHGLCINPHALERRTMRHGRNDEPAAVFKADKATVK